MYYSCGTFLWNFILFFFTLDYTIIEDRVSVWSSFYFLPCSAWCCFACRSSSINVAKWMDTSLTTSGSFTPYIFPSTCGCMSRVSALSFPFSELWWVMWTERPVLGLSSPCSLVSSSVTYTVKRNLKAVLQTWSWCTSVFSFLSSEAQWKILFYCLHCTNYTYYIFSVFA